MEEEFFDVIVIGSGPAGYVAAIRSSQLGLKTACIEKRKELGGTCLNIGCIPSKSLLYSSELYHTFEKEASTHGIFQQGLSFDLAKMMERKEKIVSGFVGGIDFLFKKNKIARFEGRATLLKENKVKIVSEKEKIIKGKSIILATGSEPISLPFLPFDEQKVLSSTGALSLKKVPNTLLVIGAGIIGVELGSVYSRLGSKVVFIEFLDSICPSFDRTLSQELQKSLTKQGMEFHLSHKVTKGEVDKDKVKLTVEHKGNSLLLEGDAVLVAIGRKPYTENLGLEELNVKKDQKGFVVVDSFFRTSNPSIYAIGDLIEGPMLAHKASEEGIVVAEIIAGKSSSIDYMEIPSVAYTSPEVASVGLTEEEAKSYNLSIETASFPFKANSRARCIGKEEGFVKMVVEKKSHRLLGVHIISAQASELIGEAVIAIRKKMTVDDLAASSHAHPTLSEAIKEAALSLTSGAIHA